MPEQNDMLKFGSVSKLVGVAVVTSGCLLAGASVAFAGPSCTNNPDVLGTSRTITVRPSDFPRIGTEQYAESLRLKNREVVLTFDDGPVHGNSAKVLDALAAECVKATFFMMGLNVAEAPALVRRAFDEGHSIGTHTFSHIHLDEVPFEKAKQEIELGIEAVTEALGKGRSPAPFFRAPYLGINKELEKYLYARGLMVWDIDVNSLDWSSRVPGEGDREHPRGAGEEGQRHLADARHQVADGACHAGSALRAQAPRVSYRARRAGERSRSECVEQLAARAPGRLIHRSAVRYAR